MPRTPAATARCQMRRASINPSVATMPTVRKFTASTTMMMARWLKRSAASPPTRTNATKPAPRQVATSDSAAGSLSRAMTCSAITTVHMPSAKIDSETAAINSRYSRTANGASTRHRPAPRAGFWSRVGVLISRWSSTESASVQRFSGQKRSSRDGSLPASLVIAHWFSDTPCSAASTERRLCRSGEALGDAVADFALEVLDGLCRGGGVAEVAGEFQTPSLVFATARGPFGAIGVGGHGPIMARGSDTAVCGVAFAAPGVWCSSDLMSRALSAIAGDIGSRRG